MIDTVSGNLKGNYTANNGVEISKNIISAKVDNDTVKLVAGKLTSTQLF